ncbi:hypothetical protein ACIBEJ_16295 [Nonomuraea sp. NPDC050790]|uniref:hypothetical protein n=1 Tax=Nonomuraea sp. NPDC050790 TaxID=3364371 RepID=UPI0037ACD850
MSQPPPQGPASGTPPPGNPAPGSTPPPAAGTPSAPASAPSTPAGTPSAPAGTPSAPAGAPSAPASAPSASAGTPSAASTAGPPAGGPAPASSAAAGDSFGQRVHTQLKKVGKLSIRLSPAIFISAGLIANEPGMAQAATNWKHGIAARLDDGIKQLLPQLLNTSKDGWIARDREEFERILWLFHREIGALRSSIGDVGGMIDEVAASYRAFWLRIITLAIAAVGLLMFAKRLQAVPQTTVTGMLLEKIVTNGVNTTTAILAMVTSSTLKAVGDVLATVAKKRHQFGYVAPGGEAAIDFKSITIDTSKYPSFKTPPKPDALPDGWDQFDWLEPKRVPGPITKP